MGIQDIIDEDYRYQHEPVAPLDRKLAELSTRIARLERQSVLADADVVKIRRLAGSALVLIGRRLRQENLDD